MKKKKIIQTLNEVISNLRGLINASKGDYSKCGVNKFEDIGLFLNSWCIPQLEEILEKIKR